VLCLIREHDALNGLRFSALEFGVMAVVVGGLGSTSLPPVRRSSPSPASASSPTASRSRPSASAHFGPATRIRASPGPSAPRRARILEEHPNAQRATWLLAGLTLIPFAVATAAVVERVRRQL
jgi:hypothetical protein